LQEPRCPHTPFLGGQLIKGGRIEGRTKTLKKGVGKLKGFSRATDTSAGGYERSITKGIQNRPGAAKEKGRTVKVSLTEGTTPRGERMDEGSEQGGGN